MEEEVATHPSILAWEIPWTEEPGRLHSIESQSQTQLKQRSLAQMCAHFFLTLTLHVGIAIIYISQTENLETEVNK